MVSNNYGGGHALGIATRIIFVVMFLLAGSAHAETAIWDESRGSPLPFTWNITNFDGFNVGGVGTENLTVWQTDLKSTQRTIAAGNLTYSTTAQAKKLNVVIALNLTDNTAMTYKGLEQAAPGRAFDNGEYYIVNWQAERYVAVNRKVDKLARLVMEQGLSEKKTMLIGESWDLGGGWALLVNSIDAKATPRQVWLSLYKDGIRKDDKVVTVGGEDSRPIYTYVERSLAGESDVPLFVTYVERIFTGTTSDIVQFGGAWALSTDVTVIQSGSTYGIFRDAMVSFSTLSLMNSETPVTLSPNTTIDLIGNIKFNVINDTAYLKFNPSDEPGLNISASSSNIQAGTPMNVIFTVTSGGSPVNGAQVSLTGAANASGITDITGQANMTITAAYAGNITADAEKSGYTGGTTTLHACMLPAPALDSWALGENYILNLIDIDPRIYPKQARLQLSKDGILVKDSFVEQDEVFEYCPSNCIFNATVDVIFNGTQGVAVRVGNASQYYEVNGTPVMTDAVHLFRSVNFTGISWLLDEGYDLKMMDIDYRSYPRLVWFRLLKNGTVMDDAFLSTDERYTYISPFNSTILTSLVDVIFKGDANSVVKLTEIYQYSETSGGVLLDNAMHSYISGEITRTDLPLYEGYNLSVIGIDAYGYPRMGWLQLYKNDTMVDDKIIDYGDIYIYENLSGIILYAQNSAIFSGSPLSAVKFRNVTQYSEIDGSVLINGATYIIALYGTPVPVPIPSVTQPSGYGTFEVRGIPASGAFKWTPQNFAGFYYDINSNTGKEELNILQPDLDATRTIDKGNLTYSTTAQPKMLNVVKYAFRGNIPAAEASGLAGFDNGNYYILGWQGERFTPLKGKVDKLAGLVLEQGVTAADKKTLATGESWDIGGNWTLTVQSIDVKAYPRQAWLTLGKDGTKIEDIFVAQQNIYTYVKKSFSNETDVPLFMTYLDTVFAGATTDMVQLRYTWALNTSVTEIMYNETYGIFTDAEVSSDKTLKFKNSNTTVSLTRGSTIDLLGPLRLRVADNDTLRFMPVAVHKGSGTEDIRGAVWNETPIDGFGGIGRGGVWNASNFAGFFYDIDNDLGKEELHVLQTDLNKYQRTILKNNLAYTTSAQPKMLNLVKYAFLNVSDAAAAGLNMTLPGQAFEGGNYQILGWQGEKHVAVNGSVNRLSDFILEQGVSASEKKTMLPNETWNVGGGWSLTLDFADARSSPRKAGITLRKDGEIMGSRVLTSGPYGSTTPVYTYVDRNTTVPLFVTYVDAIFAGAFSDMAQFRYTWAVSPEVTRANMGDRFGVFNVTEVNTTLKRIGLRNVNTTISLSQYSGTVDLMGELKFRIADDAGVLRFYLFKKISTPQDGMPPGSIFSLRNTSYAEDHINWIWLIPADIDFDHVQVYLDGNFKANVPGNSRWFTAVGLTPGTEHTISTHTVDTWGNINTTWVNHTARTAGNASGNDISSCTVISSAGNYVLTQDIMNSQDITCIVINSGGVVLDGAGHTIDGIDALNSTGVHVNGQTGVTVRNLKLTDWSTGIYYHDVTNGSIISNHLDSNSYAGINFISSMFSHSVSPGYSTIALNDISNSDYGILLLSSGRNNITGNNISYSRRGIALWFSSENNISRNIAVQNGDSGIYLEGSVNNALTGNSVTNNARGMNLSFISNDNLVRDNILTENDAGLLLGDSYDPVFSGKFCIKCHQGGQSGFNTIYNNIFNNTLNYGTDLSGTNTWNILKTAGKSIIGGPYLGGNFWAKPDGLGFSQTCTDADRDGICDANFTLNAQNIDHLPLTMMTQNLPPVADCGPDKLRCENVGSPVYFNASSSYDPDGTIISYAWEFGDGTNGTGVALTHKYTSYRWNGTAYLPFIANLTVTDNSGMPNSTSQKVVIWRAGDANGDGNVNIVDAAVVGLRWGYVCVQWDIPCTENCADLNNDGKVNIVDASIIGLNWGKIPIIQ